MFKVVWDKAYNGVRLTLSASGEALAVSPRPVFWEELDLLGLNKRGWIYPHAQEPLLWACDRRYFYRGELVMEVKGGNIFDAPTVVVQEGFEALVLCAVDMEQLRKRNEDTMFIIEHEAMDFINQTYRRYKNISEVTEKNPAVDFQRLASNLGKKTKEEHVVVKEDCDSFDVMPLSKAQEQGKAPILNNRVEMFIASFSGGKDSQVVLDLVSRVIPSKDFLVIYSDTGYELPTSLELYKEVQAFYKERYPELRFYTARNHQPVLYYWDEMGPPSRVHRWCCAVMKSAPLSLMLKQIKGNDKQPSSILFDGVRSEESVNRANRNRIGSNVKHNGMINARPILSWNATEVYLYLMLRQLPLNAAYRHGLSRVGCAICPYSSGWSEDLCGLLYPDTVQPFINKIRSVLSLAEVSGIDNYIGQGKWKTRAGGRSIQPKSSLLFSSIAPTFVAIIRSPKENLLTWLKVLGEVKVEREYSSCVNGNLRCGKDIYRFEIEEHEDNIVFNLSVIDEKNIVFIKHLKAILFKATYCIHCGVCEVECPSGALRTTPIISVNQDKCIHCFKCLDFHDKGCMVAHSISTSNTNILNNNISIMSSTSKTGIDRYRDGMGLRERWLQEYFSTFDTFFDEETNISLNPKYQLPPFVNWIREAEILSRSDKRISDAGLCMHKAYLMYPLIVWELIFIGLCDNSEICHWYQSSINYNRRYTREEIDTLLQEAYPDLKDRTLRNPMNSLLNTFKESPLGSSVPVGVIQKVGSKVTISRRPHESLSPVAAAYSLYRYAERQRRTTLTVSEFYDERQTEGVYRQFGITRETFERLLLGLQEESNHVLRVELNMGLDNIVLREDLKPIDILKLML